MSKDATAPRRPTPDALVAFLAALRLSIARSLIGTKAKLAVVSVVLVVVAAIAIRYAATITDTGRLVAEATQLGVFHLLAFLFPFLFASGAFAEEAEQRTLTYLLIRPISRWSLLAAKWSAAWIASALFITVAVVAIHLGCFATEPSALVDALPATARRLGALLLLEAAYTSICLFWGTLLMGSSGLASVMHLAAVEFAMGFAPFALRFASMNYLARQLAGYEPGGIYPTSVPAIEPWAALAIVATVAVGLFAACGVVVRHSDMGLGRA